MNWNDENLLEVIELHAEGEGWIASEQELSDRFDDEIAPLILENHGIKGELFDDTDMMNEEFSYWSDNLCKDGEIHPEQYSWYGYVGKYS
jgi:hypothetical protein